MKIYVLKTNNKKIYYKRKGGEIRKEIEYINQEGGGEKKWKTLEHNGVIFAEEYKKHNIPVEYKGEEIILDKESEEYATMYAKYIESEYIKNKMFNKNFWKDWREKLGKKHKIQDLENCNFKKIYEYLIKEKERKKEMTKEEKERKKEEKEKKEEKYKYAIVDGKKEPVGNYRIEPPGIFIGRGCHPKIGRVKKRIYPEDITINIGKESEIPKLPEEYKNRKWGLIVNDKKAEWLAAWKEPITKKIKYVRFASHSKFKTESDIKKFDLARKLKKKAGQIRKEIDQDLKDKEKSKRQLATALYMIDNYALRVGNERGEEAADTVGVTILRVEHIKFLEKNKIMLDFLGKDSIRYKNTHTVSDEIYNNLKEFTENKEKKEQLFDKIDSNMINRYLQNFMKGLTAKVFRTYKASNLLQKELNKIEKEKKEKEEDDDKIKRLLQEFNKANTKVALLCNHQKKVSKTFNEQVEKIDEKIKEYKKKIQKLKRKKKSNTNIKERIEKIKKKISELKAKKSLKIETRKVSLETSKANYIDPRIIMSYIKRNNIPIEKIYSKTLQEKFKWATSIDKEWRF